MGLKNRFRVLFRALCYSWRQVRDFTSWSRHSKMQQRSSFLMANMRLKSICYSNNLSRRRPYILVFIKMHRYIWLYELPEATCLVCSCQYFTQFTHSFHTNVSHNILIAVAHMITNLIYKQKYKLSWISNVSKCLFQHSQFLKNIHHAVSVINELHLGLLETAANTFSKKPITEIMISCPENWQANMPHLCRHRIPAIASEVEPPSGPARRTLAWLSNKTSPGQIVGGEGRGMSMWSGKKSAVGPHRSVGAWWPYPMMQLAAGKMPAGGLERLCALDRVKTGIQDEQTNSSSNMLTSLQITKQVAPFHR